MSAVVAAFAATIAVATAWSIWRRFRSRGGMHNFWWSVSLAMFAAASLLLAWGLGIGWSPLVFGGYYLFGAILNVPFLGLGQIALLWPDRLAYAASVVVVAFALASVITVATAPMSDPPSGSGFIPSGKEVYATTIPEEKLPQECLSPELAESPRCSRQADPLTVWPRILAVIGNVTGTLMVLVGTTSSALRLLRRRPRTPVAKRLALGNFLIAAGVSVVASGGGGARVGKTFVLPFTLAAGVSLIYLGFLTATSVKRQQVEVEATGEAKESAALDEAEGTAART